MVNEGLKIINSFQELTAPDINYDILGLTANDLELQAANLELRVTQEANRIRQDFTAAAGAAISNAARRGVKVSEGDIQANIEKSAGNVGKDIQTAKENVKFKQGQIKGRVKSLRGAQKTQGNLSLLNNVRNSALALKGTSLDVESNKKKAAAKELAKKKRKELKEGII